MRRRMASMAALTALLATVAPVRAAPSCKATIAELTSDTMFARYPARVDNRRVWRAPDVRTGRAHLYRTAIRSADHLQPDFAGHIVILWIGCGAGTICPAFMDRANGRVSFPSTLTSVSTMSLDLESKGPEDYERLTYRRDSRLLVVLGMRNDDVDTAGAALYEWRKGGLHVIRSIPERALCLTKEGA